MRSSLEHTVIDVAPPHAVASASDSQLHSELDAADNHIAWAARVLQSDEGEHARDALLRQVEEKLVGVRAQLLRVAQLNASDEHDESPLSVVARVTRHTSTCKEFVAVSQQLERAWDVHRRSLLAAVKRDVMDINPNATAEHIEHALASGELDSLLGDANWAEARHQLEDVRARSKLIDTATQKVEQLHRMYQPVHALVQNQQVLIDEAQQELDEAKSDTKKARGGGGGGSRALNKSRRRLLIGVVVVLVLIIVAAIVATILVKQLDLN